MAHGRCARSKPGISPPVGLAQSNAFFFVGPKQDVFQVCQAAHMRFPFLALDARNTEFFGDAYELRIIALRI